jgi:hypothetical protein
LTENKYIYRLMRLRRIILTCVFLPSAAFGLLALATGGASAVAQPTFAAIVLLAWLGLLIAMLLGFPRGLDEALVHSLTLTVLILVSPLFELLAAQADEPLTPKHHAGLTFLVVVSWVLLMAAFAFLLERFVTRGPRPMMRWNTRLWVNDPPDDVLKALRATPSRKTAVSRTGPLDAEGRIPVWIIEPRLPSDSPQPTEDQSDGPHYWVQILHETTNSVGELALLRNGATETIHIELFPKDGGTLIQYRSMSNTLTLLQSLFFWAGDMMADHLLAIVDGASEHTLPRAIRLLPVDSPVQWLARKLPSDGPRHF